MRSSGFLGMVSIFQTVAPPERCHNLLRVVTGLNIEQRKRLTIGVELVAKPELLLFLGMVSH